VFATFVGFFHHFASFISRVGTCSTDCTFPVSYFIIFHVVFTLLLDCAISITSFDGEITAIAVALQQLLLRPTDFKKAILLVDSHLPSKL